MRDLFRLRSFISIVSVICVVMATGCGTQTSYPNQLNAFDGASYSTLTLAHGALTSLRAQISVSYPKYAPVFNGAADAYTVAYNAYAAYRTNPSDSAALTVELSNLTVSIVALENAFQTDMQASPAMVASIRNKAKTLRMRAAGQNVTVSDVLTELEIASAVAETIPGASAYAGIASMVIEATSAALTAESASAGQPIDLTTIQPVATL